ncbi:MAG: transporter [Herminiimonas sp.]|nr:transporter [Herminiimonas sp.]
MQIVMALLSGLVFGLGLVLSGMTDPSKVLGFLDLAGAWDPSLAFVMGGAIVVGFFAFRIAGGRPKALLGDAMRLPTATQIDRRLVVGGLAFGVGWGLGGFCPGPALASIGMGNGKALIFVAAMVGGMAIFELLERRPRRAQTASA